MKKRYTNSNLCPHQTPTRRTCSLWFRLLFTCTSNKPMHCIHIETYRWINRRSYYQQQTIICENATSLEVVQELRDAKIAIFVYFSVLLEPRVTQTFCPLHSFWPLRNFWAAPYRRHTKYVMRNNLFSRPLPPPRYCSKSLTTPPPVLLRFCLTPIFFDTYIFDTYFFDTYIFDTYVLWHLYFWHLYFWHQYFLHQFFTPIFSTPIFSTPVFSTPIF